MATESTQQYPAGAGPADVIQKHRTARLPDARSAYRNTSNRTRGTLSSGQRPKPKAKLLMLEQWRACLRVSEALDLEVQDLSLDTATPTLRVRSGKSGKSRLVPVHPELHGALGSALAYGDISQGRIIEAHPATA